MAEEVGDKDDGEDGHGEYTEDDQVALVGAIHVFSFGVSWQGQSHQPPLQRLW
jgi:hypothetical protein